MAQYTITVDDALDEILNEIAAGVKLPKEKYAENIVHVFLEAQYRGRVKGDIDNKTFAELKEYDPAKLKKTPPIRNKNIV